MVNGYPRTCKYCKFYSLDSRCACTASIHFGLDLGMNNGCKYQEFRWEERTNVKWEFPKIQSSNDFFSNSKTNFNNKYMNKSDL